MQVEEKKRIQQYDRIVNDEQARIWKTDTKNYYEQEKDNTAKVNLVCYIINRSKP